MSITEGSRCETVLRIWPNMKIIDDPAGQEGAVTREADVASRFRFIERRYDMRVRSITNLAERFLILRGTRLILIDETLRDDEYADLIDRLAARPPRAR